MSLPYSTSKAVFEGNGVATRFPFTFKVWREEQLRVVVYDVHGLTRTMQPQFVELEASGGGVVGYLHEGKPLPVGWKLVILRSMPFTQHVDLISGTRFDPQVIEDQLDQAAAERQQLLEEVQRAVRVEPGSDVQPEALIEDVREASRRAVQAASEAGLSERNAAASEAASAASEDSAAASAARARAWAESPTAPDAPEGESKSAKTWALCAAQDVTNAVQRVEDAGNAQAARILRMGAVFPGCVLSFSGTFGGSDGKRPIPAGTAEAYEDWALCDGDNGTPDLRGRMVLGASADVALGQSGGAESHSHEVTGGTEDTTLTESTMPNHSHYVGNDTANAGWSNVSSGGVSHRANLYTNAAGGSAPHKHGVSIESTKASSLPPYFALAFIMKLPTVNILGE